MRRLTAASIARRKNGKPFAVMTAYDAPFARCVEEAGVDIILVGDSLGMVVLGFDSTTPVRIEDMIHHTAAAARGARKAHIIADLPFGSYQASDADAIRSAMRLVQEGRAASVKLEGGVAAAPRIRAIVDAGIPVMGHIGLLPQTAGLGPGYTVRGDAEALRADAYAVQNAGAYGLVLEVVKADIAATITADLSIPTIGIGSGPDCDGQVLVLHDLLGLFPDAPSFVKRYADLNTTVVDAVRKYAQEVREKTFPI
ncbi:MAG: 3-methyl-2-oxobutanoate hydroxymethyltransferase [Candidatus Eremiobacteraeota bacterium]|nr:3-methyl-2-oxobutanoate hydroxymethyltransferase [Candidatus Eremiobacteraeota bacterium]